MGNPKGFMFKQICPSSSSVPVHVMYSIDCLGSQDTTGKRESRPLIILLAKISHIHIDILKKYQQRELYILFSTVIFNFIARTARTSLTSTRIFFRLLLPNQEAVKVVYHYHMRPMFYVLNTKTLKRLHILGCGSIWKH